MLWHLQHLAAERTTYVMDLPPSELAFLTHKLEGKTGTIGTLKAVAFLKAVDVNFFSATAAG
jgi:hypothetical protein